MLQARSTLGIYLGVIREIDGHLPSRTHREGGSTYPASANDYCKGIGLESMKNPASRNLVWHHATVTRARREERNRHRGAILWFTGLSGAGKSTLAHAVEEELFLRGCQTFVLDGDNVRHGLCNDLGFSVSDRHENIRRVGELAKLFSNAGLIVLTAFISPLREDRARVRALAPDDFSEVYCHCPVEVCEARDVKGLYKKAREGKIPEFTGISSPYEAPEKPELEIATDQLSLADSVARIITLLESKNILPRQER
jgi:adenylylsulfate kinase